MTDEYRIQQLCKDYGIDMGIVHDALGLEYVSAIDALIHRILAYEKEKERIEQGFGDENNWNVAWGNIGCPARDGRKCLISLYYFQKPHECKRNLCPIRIKGYTPGIFDTIPTPDEV